MGQRDTSTRSSSLGTPEPQEAEPAQFVLPQFGIFAQGTHAHHFLEFDLKPGVDPAEAVAAFRQLRTPDVPAGGVNLVVAFGADAWREVAPSAAPADLAPFEPVSRRRRAQRPCDPARCVAVDQRRRAGRDLAERSRSGPGGRRVARVSAEQPAFTYRGGRDITGFIDGTANPPLRRAADVALVPPGRAGEGGSHVLAMRWVHDLAAFERLSVADQQRVIGRTKADSIELSEAEKPPTAHIARVEMTVGGAELEIFRRSVPYRDRAGARTVLRRLQRRRDRATT